MPGVFEASAKTQTADAGREQPRVFTAVQGVAQRKRSVIEERGARTGLCRGRKQRAQKCDASRRIELKSSFEAEFDVAQRCLGNLRLRRKVEPHDDILDPLLQAPPILPLERILQLAESRDERVGGVFGDVVRDLVILGRQIAQGSDVVFQVAGQCGLGALDAACQENVMAIGVDADQSFAGPCVITSALKPLELAVFETIKSAQDGMFEGGTNRFFGIEEFPDAELLAPYSDAVPQEVQDAVEEAKQKLISGEIDPPATFG